MKVEFVGGPFDGEISDLTLPAREAPADETGRWRAGERYLYRLEDGGMFPGEFRRYVYVPDAPVPAGVNS